jgi:FtsH-binding integral membrane protein
MELNSKYKNLNAYNNSTLRKTLFIIFGFFLGVCAKHYLTGWYSVVFESLMLTGLIGLTIQIIWKRFKKTLIEKSR